MELVIEVLQTAVLLSGMMFLYLILAMGLGLPMGTLWFLTFNGHESGSKAISVISGVGATILIYLRQLY